MGINLQVSNVRALDEGVQHNFVALREFSIDGTSMAEPIMTSHPFALPGQGFSEIIHRHPEFPQNVVPLA